MASGERRTAEQIRAEIKAERASLDAGLAVLAADAKRSGRIGGSALASLAGVLLLVRLRGRRRGS